MSASNEHPLTSASAYPSRYPPPPIPLGSQNQPPYESGPMPSNLPPPPPPPPPTGHRRDRPPPPIDNAACVTLIVNALADAREKAREIEARSRPSAASEDAPTQRTGITINLSDKKIASIPLEVIELIKDEIERSVAFRRITYYTLALAQNQLTSLPDSFSSLPRLRYLNLKSNHLREFPMALTRLPSLEILDISRNRLRELPPDIGNLVNLKVLALSKNKIGVLPTYIADMNDLKILKIDYLPLVFPPREVWDTEEKDKDVWLRGIRNYLRAHAERSNANQDTESGVSSDEGDISLNHSFSRTPSFEQEPYEFSEPQSLRTIRPLRLNGASASSTESRTSGAARRTKNPSISSTTIQMSSSPQMNGASFSPKRPETPQSAASTSSQSERLRSNSEVTFGTNREKRRGMPPPPRPQRIQPPPVGHHARGLSHDSHVGGTGPRSPTDSERRPGLYFRRLSSLPEHKRSSLSSARVGEAARGILYAMSNIQKPMEDFIQSSSDPGNPNKVERALYNGKLQVASLVTALEAYDEKDDEASVQNLIDSCHSCVSAFRQALSTLQFHIKESGPVTSGLDVRYSRTLLLLLYGCYVEIQSSFEVLQPLLAQTVPDGGTVTQGRSSSLTSKSQQIHRHFQRPSTNSNASSTDINPSLLSAQPIPTPRSADSFNISTPMLQPAATPSGTNDSFDPEGALIQKFSSAINASITTLPQIEREVRAAATQNLQPHITLKLREVATLCQSGTDAAKRLSKTRWDAIQEGDPSERRKFWEETNKFTQLIINIAELIKSVTHEYSLPKRIRSLVGNVVRPTKDLYIVMHSTTFRQFAEAPGGGLQTPNPSFSAFQSVMPATPLSAALGPAAQATLPLLYPDNALATPLGLGGFSAASSRTGTLLSSYTPTMTGPAQEIGMGFPGGGPGPVQQTGLRSPGDLREAQNKLKMVHAAQQFEN